MTPLPAAFLGPPLAHRGYHDKDDRRPENSCAAIRAAVDAGYGVELDVQAAADGTPVVFHDYKLNRMTKSRGPVSARTPAELGQIVLRGSDETIPTLAEVLDIVAGRAPLLIEIKDEDQALGPKVGRLERGVAAALEGYQGAVAVMSFNPESVVAFGAAAPDIPRGLTTCGYNTSSWIRLPSKRRAHLRAFADLNRIGASFISHDARDLTRHELDAVKATGRPVLCWTINSVAEEAKARTRADNITFEGYSAALPGA